jgi:5-oxoprolinase (ATP-hydrolysing)
MLNDSESANWKFWIDVGGTFTDCVALAPDGTEHFSKVLSSGVIKSRIQLGETDSTGSINWKLKSAQPFCGFDVTRREADDFWNGATLRLIDMDGQAVWEGAVGRFFQVSQQGNQAGYFELVQGASIPDGGVYRPQSPALYFPRRDSNHPATFRYELDANMPAPILAIHLLQQVPIWQPLFPCQVDLGTTRGTNALLTRSGAKTALLTSRGFQDFLRIGDQTRRNLFALSVEKGEPLFQTAVEIDERVLADGTVERVPDEQVVKKQLEGLKRQGIESLAICFMFSYRRSAHEQLVAKIARHVGFRSIRCSSEVAPVIKIVPRGETTVLDAYLNPVIGDYLNEISTGLSNTETSSRMRLMTSSGGLVSPDRFAGKDSVLSGPAGGVVGASRIGQQQGFEKIIGFDMGGTSTDVCRFDGRYTRSFETFKAGIRILTPMLEVETVAAGGGSVCWFDGARLRVGPQSAGANPGPACYGSGGPLAITDVNLFLGRLKPDQFPFELDDTAVTVRLDELLEKMREAGFSLDRQQLASGFLDIANQNMAAAIESVSVAKGYDPREYVLVSFGGAGAQHCCGVAERLGMNRILDHPQSSVLSAMGIQLADQSAFAVEAINQLVEFHFREGEPASPIQEPASPFQELEQRINDQILPRLVQQAVEQLRSDGNGLTEIELEASLDIRYGGTDASINVDFARQKWDVGSNATLPPDALKGSLTAARSRFQVLHQQQFGYLQNRPLEMVAARVEALQPGNRLPCQQHPAIFKYPYRKVLVTRSMFSRGESQTARIGDRSELLAGDLIPGPAIIADAISTTVVDAGWNAKVLEDGVLLLERDSSSLFSNGLNLNRQTTSTSENRPPSANGSPVPLDPIRLEIFNNHFSSIADQMGIALQRTSVSVNVKERLDFSCAIFSASGDLVVNAPHIPVHLGAMGETVRATIELNPLVEPGDVFVTNDPYAGGSHLPDVTVVTPVFSPTGSELWFWVASRSHHSEIGGLAPGSMPAGATRLGEEGVLIQNFRLISKGKVRFVELKQKLLSDSYPSRSAEENIADLKAQVAANQTGASQLYRLVEQYSHEVVAAYMRFIQAAAEQKVRAALKRLPDGEFPFRDQLDNGAKIQVSLRKRDDKLTVDFTGTDQTLPDNLNANRAIVSAAIMYVLRLLIDEDIPLNEGVLKPVTLILPESFLNPKPADNPFDSPAIVGGNVETSQRIVDCLLGALNLAAASQGTMNNWLMGNERFGYYETVGGGSGATAAGRGADAVHCHMTNTRLTDPEILETRYPVVLREFAIRRGSGGGGIHRGGDGIIREIEFREPMTVSLLTSRRNSRPFGLAGGQAGESGSNQKFTAGIDEIEILPSRCEVQMRPRDRLRLETPGGGGWGRPQK